MLGIGAAPIVAPVQYPQVPRLDTIMQAVRHPVGGDAFIAVYDTVSSRYRDVASPRPAGVRSATTINTRPEIAHSRAMLAAISAAEFVTALGTFPSIGHDVILNDFLKW